MLTSEHKAHFDVFGYLVLRQLLTPEEVAIMKKESVEIFEEARGGAAFDGKKRQPVQPFFERRPFLSSLVDDDRIYDIGETLLGPDFYLSVTEGNLHVGDTAWHGSDLDDPRPESLIHAKIAFYLDPVTKDTGCLRVIPGSHRRPFADHLQILKQQHDDPTNEPFGVSGPDTPCVPLESQPGDVVVFTENTFHAAFGGETGRHQHAINFFSCPKTEEEFNWVRNMYKRWEYGLRPAEPFVNSDRPRIRRMISLLIEEGFETFKL